MTDIENIVLNFGHPLTPTQVEGIRAKVGDFKLIERTDYYWDAKTSFVKQATALLDEVLEPALWQSAGLILGLPTFHNAAAVILTAIEARAGHYPAIIRLAPVEDAVVPQYELVEIINLEQFRGEERKTQRAKA